MMERPLRTIILDRFAAWKGDWRLARLNRQLAVNAKPDSNKPTVAFFVASTRLVGISLNAAFTYLAASGLQIAGYPVVYFACQAGMSRCVLGTNKDDPSQKPPCRACIAQSNKLFAHAPILWFDYNVEASLKRWLDNLSLHELIAYEFPIGISEAAIVKIPLGSLVLPSLRWALRRHNLHDDEPTRYLFREYILSAWRVAGEFIRFLDRVKPSVVVVFNGVLFPEATARWVARERKLRVITHEVGFNPYSAFYTDKEATAYPLEIPAGTGLTEEQNAKLDAYLENRFQGKFTMAGIRFWPEIHPLGEDFNQKAEKFKQIVPVFTNVIYDTSQVHANKIFSDMFKWLDIVLELVRVNADSLFVIRAHPDELRQGKRSRESVQEWVERNSLNSLPNAFFINSHEHLNSYELIERSKFVMVYNSSIGLEAALLGKTVLCGGEARYTLYETAIIPKDPDEFKRMAQMLLNSDGPIPTQPEFLINARKFMYYQIFKASLSFEKFLEQGTKPGYVGLKSLDWHDLQPEHSPTMKVLVDGIVHGEPFLMDEN